MLSMNYRYVKLGCRVGLNILFGLLVKQSIGYAAEPSIVMNEYSISVTLPDSPYWRDDTTLAIELDGYDISAFSRVDGNLLEIQLETPMSPGEHALNVALFLSNGEIESLAYHNLHIEPTPESASNWRINTTFTSNYLIDHDQNHEYRDLNKHSSSGALNVNGENQWGNLTLSTDAQAIYDSSRESSPENKNWALPEYHVTATYRGRAATGAIGIGNINIEEESLLFSSFQRRGATTEFTSSSNSYRLKLFGVQSGSSTRIDRNLITSDDSVKQNIGLTASAYAPDQRLKISAGYVGGETTFGVVESPDNANPTKYGGNSWNLALDSIWLKNSLWLHLEHAESLFDSDGISIGASKERDSADQFVLKISSEGDLGNGWFDTWSGSLQYKSVGKAFYSLGNLYIPGDSNLTRLQFNSTQGDVGIETELARESNNIDDDSLLPTQTHDRMGIAVNYTPMNLNPDRIVWRFLGSPSLTAKYARSHHHQPDTEATLAGYDLDNFTVETEMNLLFNNPHWNWGMQFNLVDQDDRSFSVTDGDYLLYQPPSDQRNRLLGLQLGLLPNERISLNLLLQWNRRHETDFDNTYRNRNLGFDAIFQLVPETLSLQLNYNYSDDHSNFGSDPVSNDDFANHTGSTQLIWHALKARGTRPTVDFYFRSSYGKQVSRTYSQDDVQWTANLGLNIHWANGG